MALHRDIDLLVPVVKGKTLQLQQECLRMGIRIMIVETRRTPLTQRAYYAQGREDLNAVNLKRTEAGLWIIDDKANERIVTKNLESIHFYDCAIDFALVIDGKPSWNTKADINHDDIFDYENVGIIGERLGFEWGGRFSFKDYAHLQYTGGLSLPDLRAGVRPQYEMI